MLRVEVEILKRGQCLLRPGERPPTMIYSVVHEPSRRRDPRRDGLPGAAGLGAVLLRLARPEALGP
jgi:hypothetical protein